MGYKHTPGPWSVKKHFSEWLIGDGNYLIATTAGSPAHLGRASAERDAANACLLAAAPELLAATDQAANGTLLDDALNHDDDSLRAIAGRISDQWAKKALLAHADRIDAAVTKAIGESQ